MFLQRKALYNLIQLNLNRLQQADEAELEPWQKEDYRVYSTEELFHQLNTLGIPFDFGDFEVYSKSYELPEDMTESLTKDREQLEQDQIFLIVFELWRRLFPERRTLSIFCDELDHLMLSYDLKETGATQELQDLLAYLQQILEEHVDKGLKPKEAVTLVQTYCANDIESFLFDYILSEIESGNHAYASELIEGFSPFMEESLWFHYLRGRVQFMEDTEAGYEILEGLVAKIDGATPLQLAEEILYFLANSGNHSLFYELVQKVTPMIEFEADFRELLEICYIHYEYLELKEPMVEIAALFHNRPVKEEEAPLSPDDPDLLSLTTILAQKLHI